MRTEPTRRDFQRLLSYLRRLYAPGFSPVLRVHGNHYRPDGVYVVSWLEYDPLVEAFFEEVGKPWWHHPNYDPLLAGKMLEEGDLSTASLDSVRRMLTWCNRSQRFTDDGWEHAIECGDIRRLLERLAVIAGDRN